MAKYLITEVSFIDNRLVQAGEEIESDAVPAAHWTPLDKPAQKALAAQEAAEAKAVEAALQKAAAQALKDNPANLTPATPQEIAELPAQ